MLHFTNKDYRSVAILTKIAIYLGMLIHSIMLFFQKDFIYTSRWLGQVPDIINLQPECFMLLIRHSDQPYFNFLLNIFIFLQIISLIGGMFLERSFILWTILVFSGMNLYNLAWAVLDGGNNLGHILLFYLILVMLTGVEVEYFLRRMKIFSIELFQELRLFSDRLFIFLCQFQIFIVYLTAVFSKLNGTKWKNGTALYYISQSDYYGSPWFASLIMHNPWISLIGTWLSIAFQLLFCFYIWNKKYRNILLLAGILFHLGIAITMSLQIFSLMMILFYAAFLSEQQAGNILNFIYPKTRLDVAFDENCKICQMFARFCQMFSYKKNLIFKDFANKPLNINIKNINLSERLQNIYSSDENSVIYFGYRAILECLRRTIFSPLLLPLLFLFLYTGFGDKLYQAISRNRSKIGCRSDSCTLEKTALDD